MFGAVIEGYPPATAFNQVEEARFLLAEPIPNGSSLKRLTFFLTAVPAPILEGLVASVYVSMYPYEHWRCLGSVSNAEPSKILNVDWPESDVRDQPPEAPCQIGVTIEAAQVAFTCAHARWSAADLSGAPKFPRFLKPETPFALHLNLSTNL